MPISLKLPSLDDNPILLAETRPHKINEFVQKLPFGDPIAAATDLIDELQILNSQKVAFSNRLNALELYRPTAIQIYNDLLPHFSNAAMPLSKNEQAFADAAVQLWQEMAYGYKFSLVDLQNKILNLSNSKSTALVVQRAIHALKEIALVYHLGYRSVPARLWSELHQLYFCAVQQSAETLPVADQLALNNNNSSVNLTYTHVLLTALADPQHLANADILKTDAYLAKICSHAELRPLGVVDNPAGVFLIALDSSKAPTPFAKNKELPDSKTDILLLTLSMARQMHQHIKVLQLRQLPEDNCLPINAFESHFEDLLMRLIKNFGRSPKRIYSRTKKSDGVELGVGLMAAHHILQAGDYPSSLSAISINSAKASRWQVLNVSAGGCALRKFSSSQASAHIGDVVTMKNSKTATWELAILRWANVNTLNQLDVGLELIAPSASAWQAQHNNSVVQGEALLLPELNGLKQAASVLAGRGFCKTGDSLLLSGENNRKQILVGNLIERTARFERFQYSLVTN
jgi:cyclic-di-GMP-binding protein